MLKKLNFDYVFGVSDKLKDGRTIADVIGHTMEELGELATEVKIADGKSYKDPGVDGIVGEAVDVIVCLLDWAYIRCQLTEPFKMRMWHIPSGDNMSIMKRASILLGKCSEADDDCQRMKSANNMAELYYLYTNAQNEFIYQINQLCTLMIYMITENGNEIKNTEIEKMIVAKCDKWYIKVTERLNK